MHSKIIFAVLDIMMPQRAKSCLALPAMPSAPIARRTLPPQSEGDKDAAEAVLVTAGVVVADLHARRLAQLRFERLEHAPRLDSRARPAPWSPHTLPQPPRAPAP